MPEEGRSERATPRRRSQAREHGQVARSRDLSSALGFLAAVVVLKWQAASWLADWRNFFSHMMQMSIHSSLTPHSPVMAWTGWEALRWSASIVLACFGIAICSAVAQTGFVFAAGALTPDFSRFNPVSNLGRLFSPAGISPLLKSILPLGFIVYLSAAIVQREWENIMHATQMGLHPAVSELVDAAFEISWKASIVMLVWAGADYGLQRWQYERSLRMTKQEVREEFKDTEGNPQIKSRLRRRRLELRRRWKMRDVQRATVVVTNPDHFAVALEYRPETMAAPVVVAKGRDLLAERIKKEARWYEIPIVENPPLAQAMYRMVEVGQAIPPKLYAAVAELLAMIFRAQAHLRGGIASAGSSRPPSGTGK